jgi:hypothetical protein
VIQTARVALELMSADLRAATPLSADNDFLGMDRQLDDVEADNLDFATHHYRAQGQAQADWCEVSYYLDKDAESGIVSLYRRRDPTPDPEPLVGGSKELIAENVRGLSCEFYDGFEWFETWGDPDGKQQFSEFPPGNLIGLPEAIRITLAIAPPEKPTSSSSDNATNRAPALVFQTTVRPALAAARWNGPKTGGRN